jgi:hypothetical protein
MAPKRKFISKYRYRKLIIGAHQPMEFDPQYLRRAVTYMKQIPGAMLLAETVVKVAGFTLIAKPCLSLEQIRGKTPREVWCLFDEDVDEQRRGLIKRFLGYEPDDYEQYM